MKFIMKLSDFNYDLPKELIDKLPTEEEINLYLNVEDE